MAEVFRGRQIGELGDGADLASMARDGMTLFVGQVFIFYLTRVRF